MTLQEILTLTLLSILMNGITKLSDDFKSLMDYAFTPVDKSGQTEDIDQDRNFMNLMTKMGVRGEQPQEESIVVPKRKPIVKKSSRVIPCKDVPKYTLYGQDAIKKVEESEGPLTGPQQRIVTLEGFVPHRYKDTKGITTYGVGQTGRYIEKGFKESFKAHEKRAKKKIKEFDKLPETMQAELIQAEYRGDLGESPTAVKLFNQGKYKEAAREFLNHAEYKTYKQNGTGGNIPARIEAVSNEMLKLASY